MKKYMFLLGVLFGVPAYALEMNTGAILEIKIPKKGLTRISVEDQRIQDVFIYPSNLQDHLNLHQSGHVFVVPEGIDSEVFLTIMTDRGVTQDLKLVPVDQKKAGPIILKDPAAAQAKAPLSAGATAVDLVKDFVLGNVPEGFRFAAMPQTNRVIHQLNFVPFRSYQNGVYRMDIYHLENANVGYQNLPLSELSCAGDVATALGKADAYQAQGTFLYVLKKETKS